MLWKFSSIPFAQSLGLALGVNPKPKQLGRRSLRLGSLHTKTSNLSAYFLNRVGPDDLKRLHSVLPRCQRQTILYTPRHCPETGNWLTRRGIGYFSLESCLEPRSLRPTQTYWKELAAYAERTSPPSVTISVGSLAQLEYRVDTIEKTVLPAAERGSKTIHAAGNGGKARAVYYREKYEEARRFIWEYHLEHRSMCFTQALRKAARHLDLGESTLKKHIKKRDFPDW